MCDGAAERESSTIDSTGIPFMVTSATADDLVNDNTISTFMMNGTVYQQALSSVYWMNYRQAQRLAVVQDDSPESKEMARKIIELIDEAPKLVSLQTVEPGGPKIDVIAKAAIAAKPNYVLWTGGAAGRRRAGQGAAGRRLHGLLQRHRAVREPGLRAGRRAGRRRRRVRHRDRFTDQHPDGEAVRRRASRPRYKRAPGFDAMQAYDSVRVLAHAMQKAKTTDRHADGRQADHRARPEPDDVDGRRPLRRTTTR